MTTILGYYIDCDSALCAPCAALVDLDRTWAGFEDWEAPLEILSGAEGEADTPTHCSRCEALIPHRLTMDGLEYVREAYREAAAGRGGRRCIVRAWVLKYLHPTSRTIVADWPERDEWSPGAWIVGWNMVGYMPESEPYAFESHAEAKQALIDDLLRFADQEGMADNEDEAEALTHVAEELNLVSATDNGGHGEWGEIVGNMSYWLNYDAEVRPAHYNKGSE
jgi:hypothetical protein